jgi:hypothetical protein
MGSSSSFSENICSLHGNSFNSLTDLSLLNCGRSTDDIPILSASEEDRQSRANIAASFQVLHNGQYIQCLPRISIFS